MSEYKFIPEHSVDSYRKSDMSFIISVILMWGIGIFTLLVCSSSYAAATLNDSLYFVKRQLIASSVGFIGLLFFAVCPLDKQRKLLPLIVFAAFGLCLLTFIPGIQYERNGAHRWIKMPFFTFQPSELVKFVIVIYLANYFDKYCRKSDDDEDKTVSPAVVSLVIFVTVIFMQKDFSTGLFVLFIGLIMFYIAKAKMLWFVPFCILGIPAVILMILTEEYRVNRIAAFLNPDEFVQSYNFQSLASKRAVSTGGIWGQGIGEGLERLNNIPEVQSDYIFAGWAEAMGFIGVILYFALLIYFVIKAVKIALRCPDRFSAFGTMGCVAVIFFQSLMNVGVVCGILPTTGIPLPFFSSGGSSIIVTLCMCGFIINASRCDYDTLTVENNVNQGLGGKFESLDISIFK
ncbi:MAG: putative lipid II flippase FtsW [Treponema sp.]|uniref:FtsW/RodA/SpoVE family cell cycle protein n=1 Tax=Treponema sp. TaxID=166 RepID=UPI00298E5409|nr:putative peptidoglycan glycosyltransferase FtsW [Treponema sp.]MCR5386510.1 putative lipid II flippase FtsW [Treponema sp.]